MGGGGAESEGGGRARRGVIESREGREKERKRWGVVGRTPKDSAVGEACEAIF